MKMQLLSFLAQFSFFLWFPQERGEVEVGWGDGGGQSGK